jgi:hypothetical protein
VIRRARLTPRRVHTGRRATLRVSLSAPGRLRITITRMSRPGRGRVAKVASKASGTAFALRLPRRAHGRRLAAGRYRVSIVAVDAQGSRSRTLRRTLVVLR